mmetsp:Transcript_57123/g.148722  ORF Transcript_57123/g.148722 Transcript_57123/m.148722 type:complete len:289 (+) Transcript_57123:245-1111(+)
MSPPPQQQQLPQQLHQWHLQGIWQLQQLGEHNLRQTAVGDCLSSGKSFAGRVWRLSQHAQGCREVQRVLDMESEGVREMLACELRGHVWEALRSPHANFVLQKFITVLSPGSLQFIVDELLQGSAEKAAKHKFGCRVFQRLVEHGTIKQVAQLLKPVLTDFLALAQHQYGNYVVQHLLEYSSPEHRRRIAGLVEQNLRTLVLDPFGSAVVSGSLNKAPIGCQVSLARALVQQPGCLVLLACMKHGCVAATRVLRVLRGEELEEARRVMLAEKGALRASKLGQELLQCI